MSTFVILTLCLGIISSQICGLEADKDLFSEKKLRSGVDCLGLKARTPKLLSWFFNPNSRDAVDTRFFISTREQPKRHTIPTTPNIQLEGLGFKPSRRTIVIAHGFRSSSDEPWVNEMEQAFLSWDDVNVVTVDWKKGANTWRYWKAVANTRVVGAELTRLLRHMVSKTGLKLSDVHMVGHSLGSHTVSFAAEDLRGEFGTIGRITGLDPAHLCFAPTDMSLRLDKNDATFVDVIHTNGQNLKLLGLGKPFPVGHVDFYPNGGMAQPGCYIAGKAHRFNFIKNLINKVKKALCSHSRAFMFFTESLKTNCSFWGHKWNIKSPIHPKTNEGCKPNSCTQMGIHAVDYPSASGTFYVETSDIAPYCIAEPKTDIAMKKEIEELSNEVDPILY